MNKGNLENESFWAHRLPVNTKLYGNKTNVVGAIYIFIRLGAETGLCNFHKGWGTYCLKSLITY